MKTQRRKEFKELYELLYRGNDREYVANTEQMRKFRKAHSLMTELARNCGGKVEVSLKPSHIAGGITAKFLVLDLTGEDLGKLCSILSEASAVTFDVELPDKVCISMNVPDVFVPRKKA